MSVLFGVAAAALLAFSPEVIVLMLVNHADEQAEAWFRSALLMVLFAIDLVVFATHFVYAGTALGLLVVLRIARWALKRRVHGDFSVEAKMASEITITPAEIERENGGLQADVRETANIDSAF